MRGAATVSDSTALRCKPNKDKDLCFNYGACEPPKTVSVLPFGRSQEAAVE